MCTVTAVSEAGQLIVTMNRDEARTRTEGGLYQTHSVAFPVDALSGGTWMGVNTQGAVMCLLNRYHEQQGQYKASRGKLIPQLLALKTLSDIRQQLTRWADFSAALHVYAPFDLLLFSLNKCTKLSWNGHEGLLSNLDCNKPICETSSSVSTKHVLAYRKQLFESLVPEFEKTNQRIATCILSAFHLRQDLSNPSYSVLMDRDRSHTKSVCQVVVEKRHCVLKYTPPEKRSELMIDAEFTQDNSRLLELDLI